MWRIPLRAACRRRRHPSAPGFRLGIPQAGQLAELGHEDAHCFAAASARLQAVGGSPVEVDVTPLLDAARLLYGGPWVAERTALLEGLLEQRPSAIDPVVRAIVQAGKGLSAVDAFRGLYAQQGYVRAAERLWEQIDVLLLPTTPAIFRLSEIAAEPFGLNSKLGLYTNFVNLLDMSAIALPAGFRSNATGVGVKPHRTGLGRRRTARAGHPLRPGRAVPVPLLDTKAAPAQVQLAVVGAHLNGMPLHWQLSSRGARFVKPHADGARVPVVCNDGSEPAKAGADPRGSRGRRHRN